MKGKHARKLTHTHTHSLTHTLVLVKLLGFAGKHIRDSVPPTQSINANVLQNLTGRLQLNLSADELTELISLFLRANILTEVISSPLFSCVHSVIDFRGFRIASVLSFELVLLF